MSWFTSAAGVVVYVGDRSAGGSLLVEQLAVRSVVGVMWRPLGPHDGTESCPVVYCRSDGEAT